MATNDTSSQSPYTLAAISAVAGVLFGIIVGYVLAMSGVGPAAGAAPAAVSTTAGVVASDATAGAPPPSGVVNEAELQNWKTILANDPKNARAAIELGNRLYDGGRYNEAVPYYQQAFALDPKNISVSTDLGTALWYTGRADDALAQFQQSLAIDPAHTQTLFNQGIVLLNGKQDAVGAIAAWEKLRTAAPGSPEAQKAAGLIEEAKKKVVAR